MKDSGERQESRRNVQRGAPGTEDQFKRGASATGSPSEDDASMELDDIEVESAQTDDVEQADGSPGRAEVNIDGEATSETSRAVDTERELEEHREKLLRLAADYDNYRKRTARERQEAGSRAQADLVRQLLDSLDDLGRFAHLDPSTAEAATVVEGVDMVEKKMLKALGAAGLEVIDPEDQMFDPAVHEAVSTEPALSPEDENLVSRVYQKGYMYNGQLLRPARVVVRQWNG